MDGHALELDTGTFNMAGSQCGVMLFADMPKGIREMARIVKPDGRVLMNVYGDARKIDFFSFFVRGVQAVRPDFTGPPLDPAPLPYQLQDPERLRGGLAKAGLKDVKVETITETTEFHSGKELWDWIVWSNPIVEMVLGPLNLTNDETGLIQQALEKPVRERAGGRGPAQASCRLYSSLDYRSPLTYDSLVTCATTVSL